MRFLSARMRRSPLVLVGGATALCVCFAVPPQASRSARFKTAASLILPKCTAAETRHQNVVRVGPFERHCGPARATLLLDGKSFTIRGGRCSKTPWQWFGTFVLAGRSNPSVKGLAVAVDPAGRTGRVKIIDGMVQVDGLSLAATGTSVVAPRLNDANFTIVTRPQRFRVTGSWTCSKRRTLAANPVQTHSTIRKGAGH